MLSEPVHGQTAINAQVAMLHDNNYITDHMYERYIVYTYMVIIIKAHTLNFLVILISVGLTHACLDY